MLCSQKATDFIRVFEGMQTPISEQLNEQRKNQVASNRHIMISILKLIHRLGKQNLAIRGKNDDRSNFNVFLNAQAEHDPILSKHIQDMEMKRKANGKQVRGTFISHCIQNELIDLIGEFLEQRVID